MFVDNTQVAPHGSPCSGTGLTHGWTPPAASRRDGLPAVGLMMCACWTCAAAHLSSMLECRDVVAASSYRGRSAAHIAAGLRRYVERGPEPDGSVSLAAADGLATTTALAGAVRTPAEDSWSFVACRS